MGVFLELKNHFYTYMDFPSEKKKTKIFQVLIFLRVRIPSSVLHSNEKNLGIIFLDGGLRGRGRGLMKKDIEN